MLTLISLSGDTKGLGQICPQKKKLCSQFSKADKTKQKKNALPKNNIHEELKLRTKLAAN